MSKNFLASAHWLIIGLILIAGFFVGKAVVTYYVPTTPTANYPPTFYSEAKLPYKDGDSLSQLRPQAYNQASQKAVEVAQMANKRLGNLTAINENINDNLTTPEATPGSKTKEYILGLTYELK